MKKFLLPIVTLVGMCMVTGCDGALPGGVSTKDGISQREITREQAKVVSKDIEKKQKAEFGTASSSSSSAIKLDAPKFATEPSYKDWEVGDDYDWGDYDDGDYVDDWTYQKQEGEDEWGYEDGEDYEAWYNERSSKKKVEIPTAATFTMYVYSNDVDLGKFKQQLTEIELTFEYDLDKYYMHETIDMKMGDGTDTESTKMDAWIYYKDGEFTTATKSGDNPIIKESLKVSETAMSTYFTQLKKSINNVFASYVAGTSYLMFVDMFKESGFECKYGSNDAGNLEMKIKGNDIADMTEMGMSADDITVNLDGSFVWDQYYMRSMELHLTAATNDNIMEEHAKLVFRDGCSANSYPAESSTTK